MYVSCPSPQGSDIQKRGWKGYRSQRWWRTERKQHNRADSHINSDAVTACTDLQELMPGQIPPWRTENGNVSSLPRNWLQVIAAGRGKINFLGWSGTGFINHILGQAQCSGVVSQHNFVAPFHLYFNK